MFTLNTLLKYKFYIMYNVNSSPYYLAKYSYKIIYPYIYINLLEVGKSLLYLYLYIYNLSLRKEQILFIETRDSYKQIIKETAILTNNYYSSTDLKKGFLTNWKQIKEEIILYKWLNIILNKYKNILPSKIYNKFYNKYIQLHYFYKTFKYLYNQPKYLCNLTSTPQQSLLIELKKTDSILIMLHPFQNISIKTFFILANNTNFIVFYQLLYLISTAYLHGQV